jgi:NitT/TauT family transport system ATP-binding protein
VKAGDPNDVLEDELSHIQIESVRRDFRANDIVVNALDDVTLEIKEMEFVAIVGPSGCGKTTLLRLVAGLDFPTSGRVSVGGAEVRGPGPDRAVVFQQFALLPWKTVAQNIAFGLSCKGATQQEQSEQVRQFISMMGLDGHENSYPHQLSGGMQQRVAIARSYALAPDVLLMDEPFGALDAQTRTVMQEELKGICRAHPRTVLFITHAVDEAVYLADRIVVMSRRPGRIYEIVDVAQTRDMENWGQYERIEDVMDQPSFVQIRTNIWRLLRDKVNLRVE